MSLLDTTGLALSGQILNEDDIKDGPSDWLGLYTPGQDGTHIPGTFTYITGRGARRLQLRTWNVQGAEGMGIKRMSNILGNGRYLVEFMLSLENVNLDLNSPRYYGWGLDIALEDGSRTFFYSRFYNYDQATTTRVKKFQIQKGDGSYYDIPGGEYDLNGRTNENKALPFYIALLVNTATNRFEGFRFNNTIKAGRLADTPDDTLIDLGAPATSSLPIFATGINPFFDSINRSNETYTATIHNLHWQRTTYLGV